MDLSGQNLIKIFEIGRIQDGDWGTDADSMSSMNQGHL
jgi:hypothetical protein